MKLGSTTVVLLLAALVLAIVFNLPSKAAYSGSHTVYKTRNSSGTSYGDAYFCQKCHPSIVANVTGSIAHNSTACICHGFYPNYTKMYGPYGESLNYSINVKHNLTKNIYCTNCHTRYNDTGPNAGSVLIESFANPEQEQSVEENTSALWHFNESSGVYANDSSPNGNNGTLKNGTVTCAGGDCPNWVTGKFGYALSFDGDNDYVSMEDDPSISGLNNATFTFWIAIRGNNAWANQKVITKWFGTNREFMINIRDANGNLNVSTSSDGTNIDVSGDITDFIPYPFDGSWRHVAVVFDNSTGNVTGYLDGEYKGTLTGFLGVYDGNANLVIGADDDVSPVEIVNGTIDDVHILNRVLNASEIAYIAGITKTEIWTPNQSAHYVFLNRSNLSDIYDRAWTYFNRSFGPLE